MYSRLTWTMGMTNFPGKRARDGDLLDDLLDFLDSAEVLVVLRRGEWVLDGAPKECDDGPWSTSASAWASGPGSAIVSREVVLVCCGDIGSGMGVPATRSTRYIS